MIFFMSEIDNQNAAKKCFTMHTRKSEKTPRLWPLAVLLTSPRCETSGHVLQWTVRKQIEVETLELFWGMIVFFFSVTLHYYMTYLSVIVRVCVKKCIWSTKARSLRFVIVLPKSHRRCRMMEWLLVISIDLQMCGSPFEKWIVKPITLSNQLFYTSK